MPSAHVEKSVGEPSPRFNPQGETLSVSQIVAIIKGRIEQQFPRLLIEGEISNFKRQASGHLYFSLKDHSSQISAVMFRGSASRLAQLPKEGDHVIVQGALNVYAPRGQMQLMVKELSLVGIGQLLQQLEVLKRQLAALGYFEGKQPLPKDPARIGVVTSPTGAAIQDMLNILTRRQGGFQLLLDPVRVQGAEAPGEIAAAIRRFNQYRLADVLIVGRGGGSIEDLWAFNERVVADAIHESEIPIISAVGHETDHTLADLVADHRAPTPSAAAEIVLAEKGAQLQTLLTAKRRLRQTMGHLLGSARQRLARFADHPLLASPYALLGRAMQQCDDLRLSVDRSMRSQLERTRLKLLGFSRQAAALNPLARIARDRQRLFTARGSLDRSIHSVLQRKKERLKRLAPHLHSLDPRSILQKGYSLLFVEKGDRVVRSTGQVAPGDRLQAQLADGKIQVIVEKQDGPI